MILVELTNTPSDWPVPTWEAQYEVIRATSEMSTKTGGFAYLDLEAASDESSPGDRDGDQPGSWACRWYDGRQSRLT